MIRSYMFYSKRIDSEPEGEVSSVDRGLRNPYLTDSNI